MSAQAHCQLIRRRRIVKADICDRHHLPVRAGDKRRQSALFFNGLLDQDARRSTASHWRPNAAACPRRA